MKEAPGSSETSVLTRATRRNNPEDTILHSHRRENLKSYIVCCNFRVSRQQTGVKKFLDFMVLSIPNYLLLYLYYLSSLTLRKTDIVTAVEWHK
jgi:hypothetical protein